MDVTVRAYEVETHLAALVDRVERGEMLAITRNGRLYDALYLELARGRGLLLETFDAALRHAARSVGTAVAP